MVPHLIEDKNLATKKKRKKDMQFKGIRHLQEGQGYHNGTGDEEKGWEIKER